MTDVVTGWLYLSDLDHLTAREWVNGLWFAVSFAMCIEFGKTLIERVYKHRSNWRDDLGIRAIVALFGYFLGETLMRGWIWLLLATQNAGHDMLTQRLKDDFIIAFIAAGISTWAALCCLFVFSRNHWSWVRASIIIVVFVAAEVVFFVE